jgi:succinate dehydrogenase / fumarate reductase cytochrome b subunit
MSRRYAYFPGCSAKGSCRELDLSTQAVAAAFDLELVELEDAGCTGAREFRAISEQLHLAANGRILALAEAQGCDLVAVCDTCLLNLMEANQRLSADGKARAAVNRALAESGLEYRGGVAVKHFLWVLLEDVGEARLRAQVTRPLNGLRVAPFYGCHIRRPASAHGAEVPDRTASLERLCQILGAEPVAYDGADKCCGFHVVMAEEKIALRMGGARLAGASEQGADCMVTPCPLCHTVLDAYQPDIERQIERRFDLPILHVSQLVGLALGLTAAELALPRHMVDAGGVLAALGG